MRSQRVPERRCWSPGMWGGAVPSSAAGDTGWSAERYRERGQRAGEEQTFWRWEATWLRVRPGTFISASNDFGVASERRRENEVIAWCRLPEGADLLIRVWRRLARILSAILPTRSNVSSLRTVFESNSMWVAYLVYSGPTDRRRIGSIILIFFIHHNIFWSACFWWGWIDCRLILCIWHSSRKG